MCFQSSSRIFTWWQWVWKKNRLVRSRADQEKVKWSFKKTWGCFVGEGTWEEMIQLLRNSFSAFSTDKAHNWSKPLPDSTLASSFHFISTLLHTSGTTCQTSTHLSVSGQKFETPPSLYILYCSVFMTRTIQQGTYLTERKFLIRYNQWS